jgi:hypothetical protein
MCIPDRDAAFIRCEDEQLSFPAFEKFLEFSPAKIDFFIETKDP